MTSRPTYHQNRQLLVVNMIGGPGVGKSTVAHGVMHRLKTAGIAAEYVSEVAKDLTWAGDHFSLGEQDKIAAMQNERLRRLVGQVEVAVMDSSLLLGLLYMPDDFPPSFKQYLIDVHESYNNTYFQLIRSNSIPYDPNGRNQTLTQSVELDTRAADLFHKLGYSIMQVSVDPSEQHCAAHLIAADIIDRL